MKHLVVGCGEVGKALMEVLGCPGYDPQAGYMDRDDVTCDIMHVCIPYSEGPSGMQGNVFVQPFHGWVRDYQSLFKPTFTVIHSTVPIGTSDSLGAHHSPIRGRHPNLAESIRTFAKYVGGPNSEVICDEFRKFGLVAIACASPRDTEAGKLLDLMQYGASVLIEKEIHKFCETNNLNYDLVYRQFNDTYNIGYSDLGNSHFIRPVLQHQDGPIGGHCVAQNMRWLESPTAISIMEAQKRLSSQKINA
jgi:hypothetical protein